VDATR